MKSLLLLPVLAGALFLAVEFAAPARSANVQPTLDTTTPASATPVRPTHDRTDEPEVAAPDEAQAISHVPMLQNSLCVNCHRSEGAWVLSEESHTDTSRACQDCHAPGRNPEPVTIHYTPGDTATQQMCVLCHADFSQEEPPLVAPIVPAAQACASCHASETATGPADHEGRSVATCELCHETEWLAAEPLPHQVKGWEDCSFCHGPGRLTPLAGAHKEIPQDQCVNCHETFKEPPNVSIPMAGHAEVRGGCTACHSYEKSAPLPLSHAQLPEESCQLCHRPGSD
jgi:hypothetical protein